MKQLFPSVCASVCHTYIKCVYMKSVWASCVCACMCMHMCMHACVKERGWYMTMLGWQWLCGCIFVHDGVFPFMKGVCLYMHVCCVCGCMVCVCTLWGGWMCMHCVCIYEVNMWIIPAFLFFYHVYMHMLVGMAGACVWMCVEVWVCMCMCMYVHICAY